MKQWLLSLATCAAASTANPLMAQHLGDIGLTVSDHVIVTLEVDSSGYGAPRRTFATVLGEEGSPHFTTEPGFDAPPGTFDATTRVGFHFAASLLVWNGQQFISTAEPGQQTGERMRASFLTLSATTGDGPTDGFDLAVQNNGGWHRHIAWTLLPAAGRAEPDSGVYLVQLFMYSTDPSVENSPPLAIVFNEGASESEFRAAFAAAESWMSTPDCPSDLNGDGIVDGADLGELLGSWGAGARHDLTGDGVVDGADLGLLLGDWGPCTPQ